MALTQTEIAILSRIMGGTVPSRQRGTKMAIEKIGELEIVRHQTDPLISVYRGDEYLGAINPPLRWNSDAGFEAVRVDGEKMVFATENEALESFA